MNGYFYPDVYAFYPLKPPEPSPSGEQVQVLQNGNQVTEIGGQGRVWTYPPLPDPKPDFKGFLEVIRVPLTRPFLDTLAVHSISMMNDLREAFLSADLAAVIGFWNEAISAHPVPLIAVLETDYNGQTLADFARVNAMTYNIPVTLTESYTLTPLG